VTKPIVKTEAQRVLESAEKDNGIHAFLHFFKAFGGVGWWQPEVTILPPPARHFRYDACHADSRTLLEIQGGTWMEKGGHNTGSGIRRDAEKTNFAQFAGYAIIQITTDMLSQADAPEVFIPLVAFIAERTAILRAMSNETAPEQSSGGGIGVW